MEGKEILQLYSTILETLKINQELSSTSKDLQTAVIEAEEKCGMTSPLLHVGWLKRNVCYVLKELEQKIKRLRRELNRLRINNSFLYDKQIIPSFFEF